LEESTFEKVTRFGKKGEAYSDIILRLLRDEPYIKFLKLAFANYLQADEEKKICSSDNPTVVGRANQKRINSLNALMNQIQRFFSHIEERSA